MIIMIIYSLSFLSLLLLLEEAYMRDVGFEGRGLEEVGLVVVSSLDFLGVSLVSIRT